MEFKTFNCKMKSSPKNENSVIILRSPIDLKGAI